MKRIIAYVLFSSIIGLTFSQSKDFTAISAEVDFTNILREWDGFGVNYVECSQTFDYSKYPQNYGGFDVLSDESKKQIVDLVFGDDGLRPNLIKMFLDPLHQKEQGGPYDHKTTTASMRYLAKEGYRLMKSRNDSLAIITTLYGPPAYITKQKEIRGRDLDPAHKDDLVDYMVSWARFLKEEEKLPIKYISLHNEGESWLRWPQDGTLGDTQEKGHDYNFFWDPGQVNEITILTRKSLDKKGMHDIGVTNGEPTNWYRFTHWGFAEKLFQNKEALDATSIVTSHGFYVGEQAAGRWFGPHSSGGIDLIRTGRPEMKAWCTSTAFCHWNKMNAGFAKEVHGNIYEAKVNAVIPWAFIQKSSHWNKPDPNSGSAIRVYDDGTWEIKLPYYYYKQLTTAGRQGMSVVSTTAMDSEIAIIGFGSNNTGNPDAFVLINYGPNDRMVDMELIGTAARSLMAFRTSGEEVYTLYETANPNNLAGTENYKPLESIELENNKFLYMSPSNSVTTFFAQ